MSLIGRYQIPIDALDTESLREFFLDLLEDESDGTVDRNGLTKFGSAQVDILALTGDMFLRHAERVGGEGNLASAVESQSIIDLVYARYLYVPRSAQAARHTILVTKEAGPTVTLPAGTTVYTAATPTAPRQSFEIEEELVMGAADTSASVAVRHGTTRTTEQVSTGAPAQIVSLDGAGIDTNTISVHVGGAEWTRVESFGASLPSSFHYRVKALEYVPGDRRYQAIFGDGTFGRLPSAGLAISVSFTTGAGQAGNVALGAINSFGSAVLDGGGDVANVTVSNTATISRGLAAEHVDVARVKAPLRLQQHDVVVSRADYEAAALLVAGGAQRARAYTRNEIPELAPNIVLLLVAIDLVDEATTVERATIRAAIEDTYKVNGTARLIVGAVLFDDVTIDINVVLEQGYSQVESRPVLETALDDFFSLNSTAGRIPRFVIDIGRALQLSTIVKYLSGFDAVHAIEFPSLESAAFGVLTIEERQIPRVTYTLTLEAFRQ